MRLLMVCEVLSVSIHTLPLIKKDEKQSFFILAMMSAYSTVHVYIIRITVYLQGFLPDG